MSNVPFFLIEDFFLRGEVTEHFAMVIKRNNVLHLCI